MNGRARLYVIGAAGALIAALVLWWQPYSADWPGTAYTRQARRYVGAALHQDSASLHRLSTSGRPVAWALRAARTVPESLRAWAAGGQAWVGEHRGDTTQVFFYPPGDQCSESPIVFRFVGAGRTARVVAADSKCLVAAR